MPTTKYSPKEHLKHLQKHQGAIVYFVSQFNNLDKFIQVGFAEMRKRNEPCTLVIAEESSTERVKAVTKALERLNALINTEDPSHEVHCIFYPPDDFVEFQNDTRKREKGEPNAKRIL